MSFLRRLVVRIAHELRDNPEVRAKATEVLKDDVKPRAQKIWREAQPKMAEAKVDLKRFARKVREEYRKGRYGE